MTISVITIFPSMFDAVLKESIIKRALKKELVKIKIYNLRDYSQDKHRKVDDRPYGGGPGMIFRPEPIFRAVERIKSNHACRKERARSQTMPARRIDQKGKVILLSPKGKRLNQKLAKRLIKYNHLILICPRYEGVDERVRRFLIDEEISVGDYVLSGAELPAMVLIDAIVRLIPGVVGDKNSLIYESFQGNILEYPQYTRPEDFRKYKVPAVLLSGNHERIKKWRSEQSLKITKQKRPDLIKRKH